MKKIRIITLGLMLAILGVLATGCANPNETDNKGTTNTSTTTPTTTKDGVVDGTTAVPKK